MEDAEAFSMMMELGMFNTEKSKIEIGNLQACFQMQFHYMNIPSLYLVQNSYFKGKKYKIAF